MSSTIDISIIMCAFNNEADVGHAIKSILNQTFTNFELLIVDDGSSDRTNEIIREISSGDMRLSLLVNDENLGLAASLNKAISHSQGRYLARMDADDFSYPERLKVQYDFLEANSNIAVVGSNADLVDGDNEFLRATNLPRTPNDIKKSITRLCPLVHPSVMYRREFITELSGYNEKLRKKQDYDLWLRGVDTYQYANIEQSLLRYRISNSKSIKTDLYGFYVRVLNSIRRKKVLKGASWALLVLSTNLLRKVGYTQKMHRRKK
jgi:glycosyltransferase involved in cell wall biosynthesis